MVANRQDEGEGLVAVAQEYIMTIIEDKCTHN